MFYSADLCSVCTGYLPSLSINSSTSKSSHISRTMLIFCFLSDLFFCCIEPKYRLLLVTSIKCEADFCLCLSVVGRVQWKTVRLVDGSLMFNLQSLACHRIAALLFPYTDTMLVIVLSSASSQLLLLQHCLAHLAHCKLVIFKKLLLLVDIS